MSLGGGNIEQSDMGALVPQSYRFELKGSAGEYFKIWIVNVLLTIVTFGVYSAWAKVRTRKYFYGNTHLAGSTFDYHADPVKILKGRIILGAVFLLYTFGPHFSPFLGLFAGFVFAVLFPWIIVRGAIFNLRNTSYRNIRFDFKKDYKLSYLTYIEAGLVSLLTLGIGYPYALFKHHDFVMNHSRFGNTDAQFKSTAGPWFAAVWKPGVLVILFILVGGGLAVALVKLVGEGVAILTPVLLYGGIALAAGYGRTLLSNLLANSLRLGRAQFFGRLKAGEMMKIYFVNLLAVVFSLGLATPWALYRTRKYRLEHIEVTMPNKEYIDSFTGDRQVAEGSVADAAVDFWDIDLGF